MNVADCPWDDMHNDYPHTRVVMVVVVMMVLITAVFAVIKADDVFEYSSTISLMMAPKVKQN
ncbi:MAG: hypothetical protein KF862_18990 [Chitinophagaceae bacterium]|nr:hypothetical protein [Chitinophagaceae bacterium]